MSETDRITETIHKTVTAAIVIDRLGGGGPQNTGTLLAGATAETAQHLSDVAAGEVIPGGGQAIIALGKHLNLTNP
jgi:hypothetical protein